VTLFRGRGYRGRCRGHRRRRSGRQLAERVGFSGLDDPLSVVGLPLVSPVHPRM